MKVFITEHKYRIEKHYASGYLVDSFNYYTLSLINDYYDMNLRLKIILFALLTVFVLATGGCSRKNVRHLASDICMISKGISQQEVMAYLGAPDERRIGETGEIWTYYQVKKSMLRKTPFIGDNLGSEDVDMATVQFAGDKVITCVYRSFSPDESENSDVKPPLDESGNK